MSLERADVDGSIPDDDREILSIYYVHRIEPWAFIMKTN